MGIKSRRNLFVRWPVTNLEHDKIKSMQSFMGNLSLPSIKLLPTEFHEDCDVFTVVVRDTEERRI
jgi:hypothetical protein